MTWYRHTITKRLCSSDALNILDVAPIGPWEPIGDDEAAADARYVRNPGGRVESVFAADAEQLLENPGWTALTIEEAKAAAPELFGSEPASDANEIQQVADPGISAAVEQTPVEQEAKR